MVQGIIKKIFGVRAKIDALEHTLLKMADDQSTPYHRMLNLDIFAEALNNEPPQTHQHAAHKRRDQQNTRRENVH